MEITFRQYQLSDVEHFMAWACDPEVIRYSQLQFWLHENSSKEDILSYFTRVVFPQPWYRAICLNGEPIGFICLEPMGPEEHNKGRVMVSCAIGRKYWGQGIVTVALRKAVSIAFSELPHLNRIQAFVYPANVGSQKVLEKVGFRKECLLRSLFTNSSGEGIDSFVYSLVPADLVGAKL